MASLLRAALEGELGNPPEDERELMEIKGPLSEVFSQALNQVYARPDAPPADPADSGGVDAHGAAGATEPASRTRALDATKGTTSGAEPSQALESQANDALALAQLISNVELTGADTAPGTAGTTVYGVSAAEVKPEHIVEVSQDLAQRNPDVDDYVLVMDATQPSVNGSDSSNPEPRVVGLESGLSSALEALVVAYGSRVYPSLEAFARDWLERRHRS